MKKHLQRILALLCVMALVFGAVTALAEETEAKVITVKWSDSNNYDGLRPASVTVKLGDKELTLDEKNGWTGEVSVPAGTGNDWTYDAVSGYVAHLDADVLSTLTYTHAASATYADQTAVIKWEDGDNAKKTRPDAVKLLLLADGEPCGEPKNATPSDWTVVWKDQLVSNPGSDKPIVYSVRQIQDPAGYTAAADGLTVTNTLQTGALKVDVSVAGAPEGTDLSGLKLTVDGPDPSMPLTVSASTELTGLLPGAYLIRDNNADNLVEGYIMDTENSKVADAVYLKSGETAALSFKYAYKEPAAIEEETEDYDPTANIGALSFEILGPDARMPMTITYDQFIDGKYELPDLEPGVYTVVERNAETLVKYYTLTSQSLTALKLEVTAGGSATAKLFNQYTPAPTPEPDAEFVDIPVTKTWNDSGDKDGNRPDSVTVRLFADGVEIASHVLTAAENWVYTFEQLPHYKEDNKTEIVYSVNEDPVPMYSGNVIGYNLVNTYLPEVTSKAVAKIWLDNDNEQELRPRDIAVSLIRTVGGVDTTVANVILNDENGWAGKVDNLPTIVNGEKAVYSWKEQSVLSYTLNRVEEKDGVAVFYNKIWERPETPNRGKTPKVPGKPVETIEDYDTPLGVEIIINHVGDCFD